MQQHAGEEGLRKAAAMNQPFYLLREMPAGNELTGNTNLITHYNLEHAYNKFCGKKVKEKLSNFLPELPGMIDMPGTQDTSSLHSLIEKPPICGNTFNSLTGTLLTGFRLHAGPKPLLIPTTKRKKRKRTTIPTGKRKKKKKRKKR
ncbi:UNVERIFIED_CONTAM: hypothetical protein FKN15_016776 [Acipenser sinensis]